MSLREEGTRKQRESEIFIFHNSFINYVAIVARRRRHAEWTRKILMDDHKLTRFGGNVNQKVTADDNLDVFRFGDIVFVCP